MIHTRFGREETVVIGGERGRIEKKFRTGEPMTEREALALLLTFAVKKRDTNVLADRLLYRFHGLSGVMDTPAPMLVTVPGITYRTAALLKLVPALRSYRFVGIRQIAEGKKERQTRAAAFREKKRADRHTAATAAESVLPVRSRGSERKKGTVTFAANLRRMRGFFTGERTETAGVLLLDRRGHRSPSAESAGEKPAC